MKGQEKKKNPAHLDPGGGGVEPLTDTLSEDLPRAKGGDPDEREREIDDLKRRLEEKEKESKEHYDRLLRVSADFENYKKRAAREKEETIKFANEDLMKAILPFVDNLERALNHAEAAENMESIREGLNLTLQQLLQTLTRFGLSPIEAVGKPFDPTVHEAMLAMETDEHEPNRVVGEFQKGYLLKDRLLRPATVSVSKARDRENS